MFWPFIPIKFLNISDEEHALQKNTIAAQLEPIEIDMIEECHNINAVNCNVQRETIQWPEHILLYPGELYRLLGASS
jgi:hypothetical protein